MEWLPDLLWTAQVNRWIRGFKVKSSTDSELEISDLQYADNTVVFCEANSEQVTILRVIFNLSEATSGLHINWTKSFIYPVNMVNQIQGSLADILGGRIAELPTIYLWMPLGQK